jgi:hypothetical protein
MNVELSLCGRVGLNRRDRVGQDPDWELGGRRNYKCCCEWDALLDEQAE